MIATLKRIYKNTHNVKYLTNAVKQGFITEDDKARIIAEVA